MICGAREAARAAAAAGGGNVNADARSLEGAALYAPLAAARAAAALLRRGAAREASALCRAALAGAGGVVDAHAGSGRLAARL